LLSNRRPQRNFALLEKLELTTKSIIEFMQPYALYETILYPGFDVSWLGHMDFTQNN